MGPAAIRAGNLSRGGIEQIPAAGQSRITEPARQHTVVILPPSMAWAGRVGNRTLFLHLGRLIAYAVGDWVLVHPAEERTRNSVTGWSGRGWPARAVGAR